MLTLGVECYLRKPLVEAVLIDCLRSAVARGKAPRGLMRRHPMRNQGLNCHARIEKTRAAQSAKRGMPVPSSSDRAADLGTTATDHLAFDGSRNIGSLVEENELFRGVVGRRRTCLLQTTARRC